MEEVLEKLETTLISPESNVEGQGKAFETLYKNWGKLGNQEERRKELLYIQKSNRNDILDKFRGIMDLINTGEENNFFKKSGAYYRPSIYVAGFNKASASYKNVLMMSEWMVEKPEDFDENWLVVPCPKGVRMLVVANNGITKFFTKFGQFRFEKRTALPGGFPCDTTKRTQCSVIDVFYQEKNNRAYILDLLAWNNQPMTDGETEFRHYWLKSKLAEIPNLKIINKKNQVNFTLLPKVSCSPESIREFMMQYPPFECNYPPQDGLLFYHKKSHYISGETPLVGWLYPYMVPEVLGAEIPVHHLYLLEKPSDYVNQADFIQKFEAKYAKRSFGKPRNSTSTMDTTEINESKETDEHENSEVMEAEQSTSNVKEESSNKNVDEKLQE